MHVEGTLPIRAKYDISTEAYGVTVADIIQSWIKGDFSVNPLKVGIKPSIIRRPELGMLGEELVPVGEGLAERLNMKEM